MKILEYKGDTWRQGLSLQTDSPVGGAFRVATGFDPFERLGYAQPALAATELTAPADAVTVLTPYQAAGVGYVYAHTPTKLYRYLQSSPFTQTDQTSSINVSAPVAGAVVWRSRYIYAQATDLRSWDFASSDVQILNGSISGSLNIRKLCVGADQNLYVGDNRSVGKCIIATGTSGNALQAFDIDLDFTVRDLINDGRYLVILADNNHITTTSRATGSYKCRIYFWDMVKGTADVIHDIFNDSYIIGAAFQDGRIYVYTYNGVYVCNSQTPPVQILSFLGNSNITNRPLNPYNIAVGSNSIYWGDGGTNGQKIYAYGSLPGIKEKIWYTPYITHGSTYAHTALLYSANTLFTGVDAPKVYVHNTGSTRGNTTLQSSPIQFSQPYEFDYVKVTLRSPLSSGQSVIVSVYTADGTIISSTDTKFYSADNARRNLIFTRTPLAGSVSTFEDLYFNISLVGGAVAERVSVYATPQDDDSQTL